VRSPTIKRAVTDFWRSGVGIVVDPLVTVAVWTFNVFSP
jgi:hypothetical protein